MAKSLVSSTILCALLCFLLIAAYEMQATEGAICGRNSQTWSGMCVNSGNCDKKCKSWERALHGTCHWRAGARKCICYFNC